MKAFVVDRYGSRSGLKLREMPSPELREDEVMVEVHAAGVNPLDSKIRNGEFKLILPYRPPFTLGHEVSSFRTRREASRRNVGYSFLFMKASGTQLREITRLIDSGAIRAVVDRVFPFESTVEALAYVESGRARGKVVVNVR
jgi:NADPH:quinone reductase-like Zn-dependent oxidoreductase